MIEQCFLCIAVSIQMKTFEDCSVFDMKEPSTYRPHWQQAAWAGEDAVASATAWVWRGGDGVAQEGGACGAWALVEGDMVNSGRG
ncbi:Protein of unknown function [Gryllus bimaculatus]|nr:Protein of unknown function [Gryllus bimaculatus]